MKIIKILIVLMLPLMAKAQSIDSIVIIPSQPSPTDTIYAHLYITKAMSNLQISRITIQPYQNLIQANVYWKSCGAGFPMMLPFDTILELGAAFNGTYLVKTITCGDSNTVDSNCRLQQQPYCGDTILQNLTIVSINDQSHYLDINYSISPNPFHKTAIITFDRECRYVKIELSDMYGRIVTSDFYRNRKDIELDANGIAKGAYILRLTIENHSVITRKIVIQ